MGECQIISPARNEGPNLFSLHKTQKGTKRARIYACLTRNLLWRNGCDRKSILSLSDLGPLAISSLGVCKGVLVSVTRGEIATASAIPCRCLC